MLKYPFTKSLTSFVKDVIDDHPSEAALFVQQLIVNFCSRNSAGIRLEPGIAYGEPSELTPDGEHWGKICSEDTVNLELEHFLFPSLILTYIKNNLNYNRVPKGEKNQIIGAHPDYFLLLLFIKY
jgi:hypothetical protein